MKLVRLVVEMVVEDNTKLDWVADSIWEQLNSGEDITGWHEELLEGNVSPIYDEVE